MILLHKKNKINSYLPICILLIYIFVLIPFTMPYVYAESPSEAGVDMIFLVDVSNSMNAYNAGSTANEIIKMFIDMNISPQTRVAIIGYNDQLAFYHPFTSIYEKHDKELFIQKVGNIRCYGGTDIGIGLQKAIQIIHAEKASKNTPYIVLLNDGDAEITSSSSGRDSVALTQDIQSIIQDAQRTEYSINAFVMQNKTGSLPVETFEQITSATNGLHVSDANLFHIMSKAQDFFSGILDLLSFPVATISTTGELQDIQVQLPGTYLSEANILIIPQHPITESQIYDAHHLISNHSSQYTMLKIQNPEKIDYMLRLKSKANGTVRITVLADHHLQSIIGSLPQHINAGYRKKLTTYLADTRNGEKVNSDHVYTDLSAALAISDKNTGTTTHIALDKKEGTYQTEYTFDHAGTYTLKSIIQNAQLYSESNETTVNIQPLSSDSIHIRQMQIAKFRGETIVHIPEYFDHSQKAATYYINDSDSNIAQIMLEDDILTIAPTSIGVGEITILGSFEDGTVNSYTLRLSVVTFWKYYQHQLLLGLLICASLIVFVMVRCIYLRPKPQFTGKLEGYFLKTTTGVSLPATFWNLENLRKKNKITLYELLQLVDMQDIPPESKNITLFPYKEQHLQIKNNSKASITDGRQMVKYVSKNITLSYNDKIYILFENGITEMDIRYKRIKNIARD